jgi:hypothetical protein
LRAFAAAARHLNFSRAGDELCITQSAVSHQVARLEAELGLHLFERLPSTPAYTGRRESRGNCLNGLGLARQIEEQGSIRIEHSEQIPYMREAPGHDGAVFRQVCPHGADLAVRRRTRWQAMEHGMLCASVDLIGTKRIVGRRTASQIASASEASFLFRFT